MSTLTGTSPESTSDECQVWSLGQFVVEASPSDLGSSLPTLKRNVLDSIACALGALDGELIPALRAQAQQFNQAAWTLRRPPTSLAVRRRAHRLGHRRLQRRQRVAGRRASSRSRPETCMCSSTFCTTGTTRAASGS